VSAAVAQQAKKIKQMEEAMKNPAVMQQMAQMAQQMQVENPRTMLAADSVRQL
jgi:hypothetical protein